MKILIIEDGLELSKSILAHLKIQSYYARWLLITKPPWIKLTLFDYECILLDNSLPDGNGLNVLVLFAPA